MLGPAPTDGPLTPEELQLAARNKGMPLEALRYDVTPTGLHYLLVHFDIPAIDPSSWRLRIGGNVDRPLELRLPEIRERPSLTMPVTLECAGNGRARLSPRPISQPWLNEAVGTAMWTGTPLAGVLADAGVRAATAEIVFTGADHGIEKGYEHDYARSLRTEDAMRPDVLLAYDMNGRPLEPQHGFPLRLLVPGWYGMTQVKWLTRIDAVTEPYIESASSLRASSHQGTASGVNPAAVLEGNAPLGKRTATSSASPTTTGATRTTRESP